MKKLLIISCMLFCALLHTYANGLNMCKPPEQVETQNQYLPDLVSQAEVATEGISLGEMNAILLQKIEELTLYMIEFEKENEAQEKKLNEKDKEVEDLEEVNQKMEERLAKIEALLLSRVSK